MGRLLLLVVVAVGRRQEPQRGVVCLVAPAAAQALAHLHPLRLEPPRPLQAAAQALAPLHPRHLELPRPLHLGHLLRRLLLVIRLRVRRLRPGEGLELPPQVHSGALQQLHLLRAVVVLVVLAQPHRQRHRARVDLGLERRRPPLRLQL